MSKSRFLYLFLMMSLSAACTRQANNTSTLQINLPSNMSARQSSAFVYEQPISVLDDNPPQWNTALDPTTIADVNCYAVMIAGPESALRGSTCTTTSNTTFYVGLFAGGIPAGGALTLSVDAGPQREITILGFHAQNGACRNFVGNVDGPDLSEPFIIGKVVQDLSPGDVTVSIPVTVDGTNLKVSDCDGPAFNLGSAQSMNFGDAIDSSSDYTVSTTIQTISAIGNSKVAGAYSRVMGYTAAPTAAFTNLNVNSVTGFSEGDEVMLIVMGSQGTMGPTGNNDYAGCGYRAWDGAYNFATIINDPSADNFISINKGTYVDNLYKDADGDGTPFTAPDLAFANTIMAANASSTQPFCYLQILKVPHFYNLTLGGGDSLTAPPFDYSSNMGGGVLAFRVAATLTLNNNSTLTMGGYGYAANTGHGGDGIKGTGNSVSCGFNSPSVTGGGCSAASNLGGGGGGHGSLLATPYLSGGAGGTSSTGPLGGSAVYDDCGGSCFGDLANKMFMGGAGGSGGGSAAGNGGGIIYAAARNVIVPTTGVNAHIKASGTQGSGSLGGGGGGAGGSILMYYASINTRLNFDFDVSGGAGGTASVGAGGGGGAGRLDVFACTLAGVSQIPISPNLLANGGLGGVGSNLGTAGSNSYIFTRDVTTCP